MLHSHPRTLHSCKAFGGEGQRLSGKVKNKGGSSSQSQEAENSEKQTRGIPNYNYRKGKLTFAKAKNLKTEPEEAMVRKCIIVAVRYYIISNLLETR